MATKPVNWLKNLLTHVKKRDGADKYAQLRRARLREVRKWEASNQSHICRHFANNLPIDAAPPPITPHHAESTVPHRQDKIFFCQMNCFQGGALRVKSSCEHTEAACLLYCYYIPVFPDYIRTFTRLTIFLPYASLGIKGALPPSTKRWSMATEYDKKLSEAVNQIKKGRVKPSPVTARTFIEWFGAQRRSIHNVAFIRSKLKEYHLITKPDFDSVWIDSPITLQLETGDSSSESESPITEVSSDPTYRIGKLLSANKPPVSVNPDAPLSEATQLMISHDYSQLPVMTNDRQIKGIVTWASIGTRLALGKECGFVRECMVRHHEISVDAALLSAIDDIVRHGYVLIRNAEGIVTGIVTTTDLSQEFRQLAEPFLLLGEIENYIRRMIEDKYRIDEVRQTCEPGRVHDDIQSISDLTLGEYLRLLEDPERWDRLKLAVARSQFCKDLEEVRQIRNKVMHFDPDELRTEDMGKLRRFVRLMQELAKVGVI